MCQSNIQRNGPKASLHDIAQNITLSVLACLLPIVQSGAIPSSDSNAHTGQAHVPIVGTCGCSKGLAEHLKADI